MTPDINQLAAVAALTVVAVSTGQLLALAIGLRRLQRLDASAAALSVFLGASFWTIGFGLLSDAGRLPAPAALGILAAIQVILLVAAWRRRAAVIPRFRGPIVDWLLLGGAVAVTTVLALLPVILHQGFSADNDTHTYCALAEWLQEYGFGTPATWPARGPGDGIVNLYHRSGVLLGASYPLALARAAGLASSTLGVYAAVSALGLALGTCGMWWMTRVGLRLGRLEAAAATWVFAAAPHAAYWAHHNGFLSQTYAVSGLLFGLAALAGGRGIASRVGLVTFSAAAAFLYIAYLPFLALLGAGALAHAASELLRARREREVHRVLESWALALALPLVLVGLDLTPLLRGAPFLLRSTSVGAHVSLGPLGLAAVALGPGPGAVARVPGDVDPEAAVLAVGAAILAVMGVRALCHERRGRGVLAAAAVLAVLLVKNEAFAQDHWTGDRGHTWLVFKVAQYALPVTLVLQAAGLARLVRLRRAVIALVMVGAASLAPAHLVWSRMLSDRMAGILEGKNPLQSLDGVLEGFKDLPPGQLVLLGQPERVSLFREGYTRLFAWPRPIVTSTKGAERPLGAVIIRVLADAPPFDTEDSLDLGGGYAVLTTVDRPRLVQVVSRLPAISPIGNGDVVVPLASGARTKLLILAPQKSLVDVSLDIEPAAGASTSRVQCWVVPGAADSSVYRRAVRGSPPRVLDIVRGSSTVVRFEATRGINAITLRAEGAPQRLKGIAMRAAAPSGPSLGSSPAPGARIRNQGRNRNRGAVDQGPRQPSGGEGTAILGSVAILR